MPITPFDPRGASDREYAAATVFWNTMRAELVPEDPPIPLEERVQGWRYTPTFVRVWAWTVWDNEGKAIIAAGHINFLDKEENQHLARFDIAVLPQLRRQGIARRL